MRARALEQQIKQDVRQAYQRLQEAGKRYSIANRNIAKARRTVSLVNERYGQGRTILIDLLQAERALLETRNEALAAALKIKAADAELAYATASNRPAEQE
jgi:outer membrane protein TolC